MQTYNVTRVRKTKRKYKRKDEATGLEKSRIE